MKATIYISAVKCTWDDKPRMKIDTEDMTRAHERSEHCVLFKILEVREIDVPELPSRAELNGYEIEGLQRTKEQIQRDSRLKVKAIEERIANLLCLEHLEA